ncbi:hypothetical protein PF010_g704 [Phytophthora fragariae]|uniref:Retrotransposon Copia-like N-terminal domain-containing protein n=1 Tax=Phytophthora fragariae TaxID=53985 RepID=A0A6A3US32_9STRA|nr:hypothetical protein PF010_g704 [Phytophthora fragariae]KAE9153214.1 hypothetical protein PF006_g2644 [Phytophthora fragariae]
MEYSSASHIEQRVMYHHLRLALSSASARNFDVWKTRVFAALDCKHLVGYVQKLDFDGISEEESDESASDVSDSDDEPKTKSSESFEVDSDAVDYDEERDVD